MDCTSIIFYVVGAIIFFIGAWSLFRDETPFTFFCILVFLF